MARDYLAGVPSATTVRWLHVLIDARDEGKATEEWSNGNVVPSLSLFLEYRVGRYRINAILVGGTDGSNEATWYGTPELAKRQFDYYVEVYEKALAPK